MRNFVANRTPFWSIWDISDWSWWNIEKIVREWMVLFIISKIYLNCVISDVICIIWGSTLGIYLKEWRVLRLRWKSSDRKLTLDLMNFKKWNLVSNACDWEELISPNYTLQDGCCLVSCTQLTLPTPTTTVTTIPLYHYTTVTTISLYHVRARRVVFRTFSFCLFVCLIDFFFGLSHMITHVWGAAVGSVDKTTDSQSWGPQFESAGRGSSALGQCTLSSLPSPWEGST